MANQTNSKAKALCSILCAEELQLLVLLRFFGSARPCDSNRQRYFPDYELQTGRQP